MDKKKFRKKIKHWFSRLALKTVYLLMRMVPVEFIEPLGNGVGIFGYWLAGKHRSIARKNLEIAFGKELTLSQRKKIAKENFCNIAKGGLEIMAYLYNGNMKDKIIIEGRSNLDRVLTKGKGAIGISAHFGNFPLLGARLAEEGYKINYVLRPMRDEGLEGYFQQKRDKLGIGSILSQPRNECVKFSLECLNKNQILFLLMDQNFNKEGIFVDFFGKKVSMPLGPIVFALRSGAEILPMFIVRQKNQMHKIYINPPLPLEVKSDYRQTVLFNTAKLTKVIEDYVRSYPTQWSWIYKLWGNSGSFNKVGQEG